MKGIFHLRGTVKNYDWGGFSFLPSLLHLSNPGKKPFAEYWIGTHPGGGTEVELEGQRSGSLEAFAGPFSYLLKILDVREMLSIQVHPDKVSAEYEFERENREGIALDDARRNYRDTNDKPELMVALGEFWLLHGFKPVETLHDTLVNVSELSELLPVFHNKGYKGLYHTVMEMPQAEVNRLLQPLSGQILPKYEAGELTKDTEDFWAARALKSFTKQGKIDRGIFSIYLFNLLKLDKGEGIFQPPGVPHAYLEGKNVEIMGNSDNVLRGGLTNKHIDIKELLKHVKLEATYPRILLPEAGMNEKVYHTPAKEFQLSVIELEATGKKTWLSVEKEVIMITEGEAEVSNDLTKLSLETGHPAVLISGQQNLEITAKRNCMVFRAIQGG